MGRRGLTRPVRTVLYELLGPRDRGAAVPRRLLEQHDEYLPDLASEIEATGKATARLRVDHVDKCGRVVASSVIEPPGSVSPARARRSSSTSPASPPAMRLVPAPVAMPAPAAAPVHVPPPVPAAAPAPSVTDMLLAHLERQSEIDRALMREQAEVFRATTRAQSGPLGARHAALAPAPVARAAAAQRLPGVVAAIALVSKRWGPFTRGEVLQLLAAGLR